MGKYGLPYQGSKNAIAEWIVDLLPSAENFYDLFAGTGAKQCIERLYTKKGEWVHYPETIFDLL